MLSNPGRCGLYFLRRSATFCADVDEGEDLVVRCVAEDEGLDLISKD